MPVNTLEAIASRRSIRKFKDQPVPRALVERILEAAAQAPSGKNQQPWRFVVVEGRSRDRLLHLMRDGIARLRQRGLEIGSAEWTTAVMAQAPVTVLVFNAETAPDADHSRENRYPWLVDVQSIGGAIQTMLLAAVELGLGSLWICDIFCADRAIQEWLGREDELVAAVSMGYADEAPVARPRRPVSELTEWRS